MNGNRGMGWLARREVLRVSKLWTQTVLASVISSFLLILVFGLSLGGRIKQVEGKSEGGGDGLTVDTKGNLYITTALGLQVFSPEGKLLGVIELPEQPANATFGGPAMKTLYATARTGLYAVPMEAQGHVFPGKK